MTLSWDERWQQKERGAPPDADPWLLRQKHLLSGGRALDLACGRGRNSLLLGSLGYQVTGIDSSATALALLNAAAAEKSLNITARHHNLEAGLPSQPEAVELILCFYYLQRNLFPAIKTRVSAGGLFIGRSFCRLEPGDEVSNIIYEPKELSELFADWDILAYEEGIAEAARGGTLAGIVARKPCICP